jgi:hypothetical protein
MLFRHGGRRPEFDAQRLDDLMITLFASQFSRRKANKKSCRDGAAKITIDLGGDGTTVIL